MPMITDVKELVHVFRELRTWHARVERMKRENFFMTEDPSREDPGESPPDERTRMPNGSFTDPITPAAGQTGTRFARNVPLAETIPDPDTLLFPDPRHVSEVLLTRPPGRFVPAREINMLAAAWIQFQVHDWMGHRDEKNSDRMLGLPEYDGLRSMPIPLTTIHESRAPVDSKIPAYGNELTHWWDGSQIYGGDKKAMRRLRVDGETASPKAELALAPYPAGDAGGNGPGRPRDLLLPLNKDEKNPDKRKNPPELSGFTDNWWVGLSMLHTLFAREHNSICAALRANEPAIADDEEAIYQTARLINTALMAKIHTVEWTPAMLDDLPIRTALYADWWGIPDKELLACGQVLLEAVQSLGTSDIEEIIPKLMSSTDDTIKQLHAKLGKILFPDMDESSGEDRKKLVEKIDEFLTGLGGMLYGRAPARRRNTEQEHFREDFPAGSVYAMTEEFVAVYRMHSLIPDYLEIIPIGQLPEDARAAKATSSVRFDECLGPGARDVVEKYGMAELFYSFGHTHPGKLVLHNFPPSLRRLTTDKIEDRDLATVDILRDRERGVPRYTRFRHLIRGDRIETFEELTGAAGIAPDHKEYPARKKLADELRAVYRSVDDVDVMVGLHAEMPRKGFAFCETAFFVFALMAPLRLRCDRFYTSSYREDIYTPTGIAWVNENTMTTVLKRHFGGELAATLMNVDNAFAPWHKPRDEREADSSAGNAAPQPAAS